MEFNLSQSLIEGIIISGLFFVFGIIASIWILPFFISRRLMSQNSIEIKNKLGAICQELSFFINKAPFYSFMENDISHSVFLNDKKKGGKIFVCLFGFDFKDGIVRLSLFKKISNYFKTDNVKSEYIQLINELDRLKKMRERIESIKLIHGEFLSTPLTNKITQLCLDIRAFEIEFYNPFNEEEMEKFFVRERLLTYSITPLYKIYESIFSILDIILSEKGFEVKTEKKV